MRISINLATQPYEDVRPFLVRWGLLAALLLAITVVMVWRAGGWQHAQERPALEVDG